MRPKPMLCMYVCVYVCVYRYNDVISASDMVDQSPVRGCMVIKVQ